jgi:xylitol oxidase
MEKRTFIKLSSAMLATPFLSPLESWLPDEKIQNWAGNLTYSTSKLDQAKSLEQAKTIIQKYPKLKVLGTRHCFNTIADSSQQFIGLPPNEQAIQLDIDAKTVTVDGGLKYGQLAPYLESKGFALHNLASLPHISVAGACATATHGSGMKQGNLATAVSAMEIVTANGEVRTLSRKKDGDTFRAAVVHLGALGAVTRVTLEVQPTFQMRQYVYENLPTAQLKDNFEKIMGSGYSVSLFTDWLNNRINEVWVKSKVDDSRSTPEADFYGATPAKKNLHPIVDISAENCTEQMGVPGPWYERMPHFKMGFTPSSGKELQSEYFVPRKNAVDAILAVERLREQINPHLLISEIRTIDADDFWMSPCYKQPSVAIHFTWKQDWAAVKKLLPMIEKELAPHNARPHWGKLFTMAPSVLQSRYEKLADFRKLVKEYDPSGKFQNEFLTRNLFS